MNIKDEKHALKLKRMGIDTHQEAVVYMRSDCHVCRSEGFQAQARVAIKTEARSIIATLNIVYDHLLSPGEAGLSEAAWKLLQPKEDQMAQFSHPKAVDSLSDVRAKVYGHRLDKSSLTQIIHDISKGRYADVHLASFITACAGDALDIEEMTYLTQAMVDAGEKLQWDQTPIVDKHCVGGLPGNRTTPIVVAIVTAFGLTMPKTSSRAITSPAGTADMMETLAPVNLSLSEMKKVVGQEGGCIVWGGAVHLSPADDILIRVERVLDLDSEGQLVASVLSKKKAAGSTHVLLDIPTGPTAKVRSQEMAENLARILETVGQSIELKVRTVISDGTQPIGKGIGPALEAHDVLAILQNQSQAPQDLKEKSLTLSGHLLELSGKVPDGQGYSQAALILESGQAFDKFQAICEAQGGFREPGKSPYTHILEANEPGVIKSVDNRKLARIAKLAGAPLDKTAGLTLHVSVSENIQKGQPLLTIHAESKGELNYALDYAENHQHVFNIERQRS